MAGTWHGMYTCADTLAKSHIVKTCEVAASAEGDAEGLVGQYELYPIGLETLDSWAPSALNILTQIGKRIQDAYGHTGHTGDLRMMEFLRQKVSIEIQRGNAVSIMGTVEQPHNSEAWFILLLQKDLLHKKVFRKNYFSFQKKSCANFSFQESLERNSCNLCCVHA